MERTTDPLRQLPLATRIAILAVPVAIVLACILVMRDAPHWGWGWVMACAILLTASSVAFGLLSGRLFCSERIRAPMRNYNRRISITMFVYVVVLIGSIYLFVHGWAAGPFGYVLAMLPALPLAAVFVLLGLYLREETDEFRRRLFAEACLLGAALTFVEASFWGFLEIFGKAPHIPAYWACVAFFAQFGLANGYLRWRYR